MNHVDFTKRFPQFADTDPILIEKTMADAASELSDLYSGDDFLLEVQRFTAHKLLFSSLGKHCCLARIYLPEACLCGDER